MRVRVQCGEGFVEQQQAGLTDEGAGEGDALGLAAGEGRGPGLEMAIQADVPQGGFGAAADTGAGKAKGDVAPDPLPGQQAGFRENNGGGSGPGENGVGRDRIEAGEAAQQGGLAGAAAAEQRDELAGKQVEVEPVEHQVGAEASREADDAHAGGRDLGHGAGLRSRLGRQASARRSRKRTRASAVRPSRA